MTNAKVIEILKEKEARSKGKGKRKKKAQTYKLQSPNARDKDTTHCFKCGGEYLDFEMDNWVGCDFCY